uniref:Uncharacterized protein n=1 Tax=Anguilla anguilla TaxID=7936 RepID=A0A0E9XH52_ANGAN
MNNSLCIPCCLILWLLPFSRSEACNNALCNNTALCNNSTKCNKFLLHYVITPAFYNNLPHFVISALLYVITNQNGCLYS